ncbi:unnamed protein product, partial [Scytosiphon promiscuus]
MAARDEYFLINSLPSVEHALGYRFRDRRLLLTALTHRSFCNETYTASGDFDELEWLGDSVLQLAVSSWLFRTAEGSRRSSGKLSATRQRFVDGHACEAFARKLNLLPFLRIGNAQPVRGTKILADCFEAVLGAVYVDAGGCSDLEPIHAILARAIPSYEVDTKSPEQQHQQQQQCRDHRHQHHQHHQHHPHHGQHPNHQFHRPGAQGPSEPPPRPPPEDSRKLMNLAHRLAQMAKRGADGAQGAATRPPQGSQQRDPLEVLREFDGRLAEFQENALRGGSLSFASPAFAEAFGQDVARFFAAAASPGNPKSCALLDGVLDGTTRLRKDFGHAPPGAERVMMEVLLVPLERRRQTYTVVEYLLNNVLHRQPQGAAAANPAGSPSASSEGDNGVLRLIRSAPHGDTTIAALWRVVNETSTNLLLNARQRAVISGGLALATAFPAQEVAPSTSLRGNPAPPFPPASGPVGGHSGGGGGGSGGGGGDGAGRPFPHTTCPPPPHDGCVPGRKRSPPPPRGDGPWGGPG